MRFADGRDLEIGRIYGPIVDKKNDDGQVIARMHKAYRPMGGISIPPFSLFKLRRVPTPTLVLHGMHSIDTTAEDSQAIARHSGGSA